MAEARKTYLGDGVYASFDGYHVVLRTEGNLIYLEPAVMDALARYYQAICEAPQQPLDPDHTPNAQAFEPDWSRE